MVDGRHYEIHELVEQYLRHPDFRDFFVEGHVDKNFFECFLEKVDAGTNANCIRIQDVNIPLSVLQRHGLSGRSEKNRVVALGLELATRLSHGCKCATCIAEADFDYLLETFIDSEFVLYTDYTCLEMYTFTSDVITKFFAVVAGGFPVPATRVVEQIAPILVDLFIMRATSIDLDLGMEWLQPKSRRFKVDTNGNIGFDRNRFIKDYLESNDKHSEEQVFLARFDELKRGVAGDKRRFIRGHDYIELFGHYIYKIETRLRPWKENLQGLSGTLLVCLDHKELCSEPLFSSIVSRLS
jgi:hypothetical protein